MKKLVAPQISLSVALAVAAFSAVGSVPASAQSFSHDGSLLPHYFDKSGELKWGSWGEEQAAAPAVRHQALRPTRQLIQNAGRTAHTRVQ